MTGGRGHPAAAELGAGALPGRRVDTLSGRQLQRMYPARAIGCTAAGAGVLLPDEPTAAPDFAGREEAADVPLGLPVTAVVTHDRALADRCDGVVGRPARGRGGAGAVDGPYAAAGALAQLPCLGVVEALFHGAGERGLDQDAWRSQRLRARLQRTTTADRPLSFRTRRVRSAASRGAGRDGRGLRSPGSGARRPPCRSMPRRGEVFGAAVGAGGGAPGLDDERVCLCHGCSTSGRRWTAGGVRSARVAWCAFAPGVHRVRSVTGRAGRGYA
ncbi:hypothetical protein GCM10009802_15800 [Streptomyces synnematoformans]|uniref:Uncharacterized protein n=1 Tax=Streptomyces synnematoformans TaxID=415721 RepID=A0ABN2XS45_9ACTN